MARLMVVGAEDVDRALREFGPKLGNRMVKSAMRKAGKQVQAKAKAAVEIQSDRTGKLKRGIKVRAFKGKAKATGQLKTLAGGRVIAVKAAQVGIQIMTTEGKHKDPGFGGAQIEFGRKRRAPYPAEPFLRPALYDNEAQIRAYIIDDVRDQIRVTRANNIK